MTMGQIQNPLKSINRFRPPLLSPANFSVLWKEHRLKSCAGNDHTAYPICITRRASTGKRLTLEKKTKANMTNKTQRETSSYFC